MTALASRDILALFEILNRELKATDTQGEVYLVGGAVMCLVHDARESTQDVDAFFRPAKLLRQAAARVAIEKGLKEDWLNDAVNGFLSEKGDFRNFADYSHLKVYAASAEYLLAMKCLAARIGEEFHDIDDIRYLLRHLNIRDYAHALNTITPYYPVERFPQKTLYLLEELLTDSE